MYENLGNEGALSIEGLKLLRSNVLCLSQLEDVLSSIDNLESTIMVKNANIASVNPTILIEDLLGSLWVFEVTSEV